jgi:hypothetical protein
LRSGRSVQGGGHDFSSARLLHATCAGALLHNPRATVTLIDACICLAAGSQPVPTGGVGPNGYVTSSLASALSQGRAKLTPSRLPPTELFAFIPNWRIDDVMISYASEGGGVGPHIDNYDVFLLQGRGRRRWAISHAPIAAGDEELVEGVDVRVLKGFRASAFHCAALRCAVLCCAVLCGMVQCGVVRCGFMSCG